MQVLVGCPACYMSAGVQMLIFRTVEQALRTAEPLTPKCQLLTRPTPLSHGSQIKNSTVGQAAVALTEDKHFDLVLQISLLRMLQASMECHVPATKSLTQGFTNLTFRLINATNPSCCWTIQIDLIDTSNFKDLREHDHWSNVFSTKTELH